MNKNFLAGLMLFTGSAVCAQTSWTKLPLQACKSNIIGSHALQPVDSVSIPTKFLNDLSAHGLKVDQIEHGYCRSFLQYVAHNDSAALTSHHGAAAQVAPAYKRYTIVVKNSHDESSRDHQHIGLLMIDDDDNDSLNANMEEAGEVLARVKYNKISKNKFHGLVWMAAKANTRQQNNTDGSTYEVIADFIGSEDALMLKNKKVEQERQVAFPGVY